MSMNPFIERLRNKVGVANYTGKFASDILLSYAKHVENQVAESPLFRQSINSTRGSSISENPENTMFKLRTAFANRDMRMLGFLNKVASDQMMYATMPAINSLGKVGGKYGGVLSEYFQTKEKFKMEGKMKGMNVGAIAGAVTGQLLGNFLSRGLISNGVRTIVASVPAVLAGGAGLGGVAVGLLQVIAGFAVKFLTTAATTAAGAVAGAKVGESLGEKYGEKYSSINLGKNMLGMTKDLVDMYISTLPTLVSREGSVKFEDFTKILHKMDAGFDSNLTRYGYDMEKRANFLKDFTPKYAGKAKNLTSIAGYTARMNVYAGTNMTETVNDYISSNRDTDVKKLSSAIELFLGAAVANGKVNQSTYKAASSLMGMAVSMRDKNLFSSQDDNNKVVSGLYELYSKASTTPEANIEKTKTLIGAVDDLFGKAMDPRTAVIGSRLTSLLNLDLKDVAQGASNPKGMKKFLHNANVHWGLQGLKVKKDGSLDYGAGGNKELEKEITANAAQMVLELTAPEDRQGGGISLDGAQEILRAIAIQNTYGEADFTNKLKELAGKAQDKKMNRLTANNKVAVLEAKSINISDKMLEHSIKYVREFQQMGALSMKYMLKNVKVVGDALVRALEETLKGISYSNRFNGDGNSSGDSGNSGNSGDSGGRVNSPGVSYGNGGYAPLGGGYDPNVSVGAVIKGNRKVIDTKSAGWRKFIQTRYSAAEQADIKNALESVAGRLNVDPNDLAALYAFESSWNTRADNGRYFGLNQMGVNELALVGLTPESYKNLSAAKQIEVTYKYLVKLGVADKITSAGDIYAVTMAQGYFSFLKKGGDKQVIYSYAKSPEVIRKNPLWDSDNRSDGGITVQEARTALYRVEGIKGFFMTNESNTVNTVSTVPGGHNATGDRIASTAIKLYNSDMRNWSNSGSWAGFCARFANKVLVATGDSKIRNLIINRGTARESRDDYLRAGLLNTVNQLGGKAGLQPGDVLFWTLGDSSGGHVAIYIGNGRVIQAGNVGERSGNRRGNNRIVNITVEEAFGRNMNTILVYRADKNTIPSNSVATLSPSIPAKTPPKLNMPVPTNGGRATARPDSKSTPKSKVTAPKDRPKSVPASQMEALESVVTRTARGNLSSKFLISTRYVNGNFKVIVKYNTGNGYKIVHDKKVLGEVQKNIQSGIARQGANISPIKSGKVYYFSITGTNVDINKISGALAR